MPNESSSKPSLGRLRRFTIPDNMSELFTTIGILTAIVVLAVIAGLFTRTFFSRVELTSLALHTFRIIQQLEKLSTDLRYAESEALAYSLTRGTDHLDRHKGRITSVEDDLEQLRLLTGDRENQSPYRDNVEESVRATRRVLDRLVALPPAPRPTTTHLANVETSMSQTREAMDAFHATVRLMRHEEERQLNDRFEALDHTRQHMVALSVAGIVLTAVLLGWLLWMIRVETETRRMAQHTLERSYAELETRVHERTGELVAANARISCVSKQMIQVLEDERRAIARDLHDEIGQALTAVKMNAQEIAESVKGTHIEPMVHDTLDILGQLLPRVRGLALELRPSLLDELGLREASKWYLNKFAKRSGLTITFEADDSWKRLSDEIEIACFRVLQEALTNVVKHARASTVSVQLHQTDDHLELRVCDNGVGFTFGDGRTLAPKGAGLGLLGMEERLHIFGGVLNVDSGKGTGTEVTAKVPLRNKEVETVALGEVAK